MTERGQPPPPAGLPGGVRDVLPVEAEELRELEGILGGCYSRRGYRQVMTPVLELAEVMDRAHEGDPAPAFRMFDDHGRVMVLRPDLTIPVARLVATRLAEREAPVRVSYVARVFRPPPTGRPRPAEQRQSGVELVGLEGPDADAEVISLLAESLRASGLGQARISIGDVAVTEAVLAALDVAGAPAARLRSAIGMRNFVAWRRGVSALGLAGEEGSLLADLPSMRGGPELLGRVREVVPAASDACDRLERLLELVRAHGGDDVVSIDFGVLRDWPYYSGVVFEAYADGVGEPVAMGGRYDGLAGRFGRPRPSVGFAVGLELLHRALSDTRGAPSTARGLVLAGALEEEIETAAAIRASGWRVIAATGGQAGAERLADEDGWRYAAWRDGSGYSVSDREQGKVIRGGRLEEVVPSLG
jgi:ATP phosphoribosyltransferase regulatory subunit